MKYLSVLTCTILLSFSSTYSQKLKRHDDIIYGRALNWQNIQLDLKLDLVYPNGHKNLPLVLMIHGGGFFRGIKEDQRSVCEMLAKRGFAVANLEYRQGFDRSPTGFQTGIALAVYRAQQDAAAALRYLVHHAEEFAIDTSFIFIGGESAGGVTALGRSYISQGEWDLALPLLHHELGSIDSSGNSLADRYILKGVINLWGGIPDTGMISKTELMSIPVLMVHSTDDEQIPFEQSSHPYVIYTTLQGSYDIAQRFKNNGGCYILNYIQGARHAYGFSQQFVVDAISQFAQNVMAGKCISEEKENKDGDINRFFLEYQK